MGIAMTLHFKQLHMRRAIGGSFGPGSGLTVSKTFPKAQAWGQQQMSCLSNDRHCIFAESLRLSNQFVNDRH